MGDRGKSKGKGGGKGWRFSARERRAVLFLLPLVAVSVWILWSAVRPRYDDSVNIVGDRMAEGMRENRSEGNRAREEGERPATFSVFDPNTVSYEEMRTMGISPGTAAGIIKYRERGKVFRIPEDFATCYGITDSMYAALKPYIYIGEEYRLRRTSQDSYVAETAAGAPVAERGATGGMGRKPEIILPEAFDPNAYTAEDFRRLGFSEKQADVIIRYRNSLGRFLSAEEFAECYVVSDEMFASLSGRIVIAPVAGEAGEVAGASAASVPLGAAQTKRGKVDLNSADSLELVSVRGIGPRTASDIIAYREKLGGFHSVEQLKELKVMTERNYEAMIGQIWADSCKIKKIDINFATPNAVSQHPYLSGKKLRKVLKNRQLKGGWSTIEDMVEDNTLTPEEAAKLAPYLHFTAQPDK